MGARDGGAHPFLLEGFLEAPTSSSAERDEEVSQAAEGTAERGCGRRSRQPVAEGLTYLLDMPVKWVWRRSSWHSVSSLVQGNHGPPKHEHQ